MVPVSMKLPHFGFGKNKEKKEEKKYLREVIKTGDFLYGLSGPRVNAKKDLIEGLDILVYFIDEYCIAQCSGKNGSTCKEHKLIVCPRFRKFLQEAYGQEEWEDPVTLMDKKGNKKAGWALYDIDEGKREMRASYLKYRHKDNRDKKDEADDAPREPFDEAKNNQSILAGYNKVQNGRKDYEEAEENHKKGTAIARVKCTGGLEYIIRRKPKVKVHFVLDGLNMEEVLNINNIKDKPEGYHPELAWDKKLRSITGAELRWLYCHWKIKAVQKRVMFWRMSGTKPVKDRVSGRWVEKNAYINVPPPWDSGKDREVWSGAPFKQVANWKDSYVKATRMRRPSA